MNNAEHKRPRGRPPGSVMPVEQRRARKDYRFSPAALAHIEQGRKSAVGAGAQKETAFLEEAIAHYVAFLSGHCVERARHLQEMEQLQSRISDLERNLHTNEAELRRARDEVQALKRSQHVVVSSQALLEAPKRHTPSYQILIRHETSACPVLPDGFHYNDQASDISPWQCPVHEVFSKTCTIDVARRTLERLKQVAGLQKIWLAKNGYAIDGDSWLKERNEWHKN